MSPPSTHVSQSPLPQLAQICGPQGNYNLADRLTEIQAWMSTALQTLEFDTRTATPALVAQIATDLVCTQGKHLRPLCVHLASLVGDGFGPAARQLALAVEMVHNATLLHDDVVDTAETRRGKPAARTIYGNAASIFAGDWLLVKALRVVNATGVPEVGEGLLAVIEEMVLAESLQLERRGQLVLAAFDEAAYLRVARGKTAALFRWAMWAGAKASGLDDAGAAALAAYGTHLGVAFQVIDDCLDFTGTAASLGKDPLVDLREGKLTYPLIVASQRCPELIAQLTELINDVNSTAEMLDPRLAAIGSAVRACGAIDAAEAYAKAQIQLAIDALAPLKGNGTAHAISLLEGVAMASTARTR